MDWEEHWNHSGETQETQTGRGRKRGPLSPDRAEEIDSWTTTGDRFLPQGSEEQKCGGGGRAGTGGLGDPESTLLSRGTRASG